MNSKGTLNNILSFLLCSWCMSYLSSYIALLGLHNFQSQEIFMSEVSDI